MEAAERLSLEQPQAFLAASDGVGFEGRNRAEVYGWELCQQCYASRGWGLGAAVLENEDRAEPGAGDRRDRQVVGAPPRISEAWLKPAVEAMLFQFRIWGFHSDNGSERSAWEILR